MRFLYIIYQICIGLPIFLVATILTALTTMLGCWLGNGHFWGYYPGKLWSQLTCFLFLLPVKVKGHEHLDKKTSYVFVANHQGSIGGLLAGSVISLIFYNFLISSIDIKLVIITIILSIVGQIGDLIMSKIKRENGIKDFSNILPGHGGILDRLDSSIFVVLAYALMMSL